MSGICGVVTLDGAPVERETIERLTDFLRYRGPDGRGICSRREFGFGHAALHVLDKPQRPQPLSLDGNSWITCDARIDAQAELRAKLAARGHPASRDACDAELILHAYAAWGEDCVGHLLGDFSLAIWDGERRRLFCARDPFGVKPFFYALTPHGLAFGNTLRSLLIHPAVSSDLNEMAIADFLVFEMIQDPATTAFADIRRLPPASCLSFSADGLRVRRYWAPNYDASVRYRDDGEYVERFTELLAAAVSDRLRAPRVGILMSGGLDSSAVAALASRNGGGAFHDLRAHTVFYDELIADDERRFCEMAAHALEIPLVLRAGDAYGLFERDEELSDFFPEPSNKPFAALEVDVRREASRHARVMLTGWDGDMLLTESPKHYFGSLLRQRKLGRLLGNGIRYALSERKLLPAGMVAKLNPWAIQPSPLLASCPAWLNSDFSRRLALPERAQQLTREPRRSHPVRPYAYRALEYLQRMPDFFDGYDAGLTRCPVEFRHPMLDLRLVEYCLSLPPYPWCVRKEVLRRSMRGVLPEAVRVRPKTPLAGYPYLERLKEEGPRWAERFKPSSDVWNYVDRAKIPALAGEADPDKAWENLRPLSLELWLRNRRIPVSPHKEHCHESA